jgi:hypothetical protein
LVLVLAGCSSGPQVLPTLEPPSGAPGPALALAPFTVEWSPTADRPTTDRIEANRTVACAECGEEQPRGKVERPAGCAECGHDQVRERFRRPYRPRVELDGLVQQVVARLQERETFARVTALQTSPQANTTARLQAARDAGAEWLLELTLEDLTLDLVEHNGLFVPKLVLFIACAILIFPAIDPPNWWIPGEDYGTELSLRYTLRSAQDGRVLDQGHAEVPLAKASYAPWGLGSVPSRGWFLAGFLRVPGCFDEEDWDQIAQPLEEATLEGLQRALVGQVEARRESAK